MVSKNILIIVSLSLVSTIWSCKQSGLSKTKAIVGTDNGKEKALAIVALRNAVEINGVDTRIESGKQLLESIYEQYFGLVECSSTNKNGKVIPADAWMNLIEFYSFSGVLYLNKDRRILVYNGDGEERLPEYFPCGVISAQLLTAPQLLVAPSEMDSFPLSDSSASFNEASLKETFLVIQSIYLAMRGPHKEGVQFSRSLMATVLGMASQSYPSVSISDNSLSAGMQAADPYYNPCSTVKVDHRQYLQSWRNENYDCVKSSFEPGIKNFRPSSRAGYAKVRQKIQVGLARLSASTKADSDASSLAQARRVLRSTEPWKNIKGADSAIAQAFMGSKGANSTSQFSLASSDSEFFRLPDIGEQSTDIAFAASAQSTSAFSLTDDTLDPNLEAFAKSLATFFSGSRYNPNFALLPEGLVTVAMEDKEKMAGLTKKLADTEHRLLQEYRPLSVRASNAQEKDRIDHEWKTKQGMAYKTWLQDSKSIAIDPTTYRREGQITSVRDLSGKFEFKRGEAIGSGSETVRAYDFKGREKVGNVDYHRWTDMTAPKEFGGHGVGRELFRYKDKPDLGGQIIDTPIGKFGSSWKANTPGSNLGTFSMDRGQRQAAQSQVDRTLSNVTNQVKAGQSQASSWGNFTTSLSGLGSAVQAAGTLHQTGTYMGKSGQDIFGSESANQKALREQGWQAAKQSWSSGKTAAYETATSAWNTASSLFSRGNQSTSGSSKPSAPTSSVNSPSAASQPMLSSSTPTIITSGTRPPNGTTSGQK